MSELNSDPNVSAEEIERDTAKLRQISEATAKRYARVRQNARAVFRAMEGWQRVGSQEDWDAISQVSHEQYRYGFFLLKRLGAERHLDPELAATIGHLRQSLLGEAGEPTAAETMLTDLAVLSYYHVCVAYDLARLGETLIRLEEATAQVESLNRQLEAERKARRAETWNTAS